MSESTHLQIYQRVFAVLLSVLPGLNLIVGLGGLVLWLLADVAEIEWGWGVGAAAVMMLGTFIGWMFIGLGIERWSEGKPASTLFGLTAPFMLLDLGIMGWLFWWSVIREREEEATETAIQVITQLSQLV